MDEGGRKGKMMAMPPQETRKKGMLEMPAEAPEPAAAPDPVSAAAEATSPSGGAAPAADTAALLEEDDGVDQLLDSLNLSGLADASTSAIAAAPAPKSATKPAKKSATKPATKPAPKSISKPKGKNASGRSKGASKRADVSTPAALKPVVVDDSDPREHLNVCFIGHVDAGKSTISGQVLYQTGMVDKRTISKFEKEAKDLNRESWFLAFIMDTNEEERAKGKTVEVGRANFETKKRRFTILDAPGHSNYVPNMISGASQADIGVLVISARRGEFEAGFDKGGQTREHAMLAKTLGVTKLIVLINKMDESTVRWNKERYDQIQSKMKPFLRKYCGFKLRKDVEWLPMSGLTGENLMKPVSKEVCPWNTSKPLLDVLDEIGLPGRDASAELRVPILDRYNDRGVIAMGKVETGTIVKGQTVTIMPMKIKAEVTQIFLEGLDDNREVNLAKPGESVRIKLKGLTEADVHKGFVICDENTGHAVKEFDARISILELLEHRQLLTAGYTCVLHCHTVAEECVIVRLITTGTGAKKKKRPTFVKSHTQVVVRIRVNRRVCLETFENSEQLGLFTLRDESRTIGVGKLLKIIKTA